MIYSTRKRNRDRTGRIALKARLAKVSVSGVVTVKPTGAEFNTEFSREFGMFGSTPGAVSGIATIRMTMTREMATGAVTPRQSARSFNADFANEFN